MSEMIQPGIYSQTAFDATAADNVLKSLADIVPDMGRFIVDFFCGGRIFALFAQSQA